MLALTAALPSYAPVTLAPSRSACAARMETVADLESLAVKLNPVVGFYDPLGLAKSGVEGSSPFSESEAIGWLRHAEIKHGRVAMAAFVGFIVQSNGIYFPWNLQGDLSHAAVSAAGGPAAQWDFLPTTAKLQILGFIGLLEFIGEQNKPHYMKGGKPGDFGSVKEFAPHPIPLDFWDPFGFTKKMTPERKEKALLAEINNGAAAWMLRRSTNPLPLHLVWTRFHLCTFPPQAAWPRSASSVSSPPPRVSSYLVSMASPSRPMTARSWRRSRRRTLRSRLSPTCSSSRSPTGSK